MVEKLERENPYLMISEVEIGIHQNKYYDKLSMDYQTLMEYKSVFNNKIEQIKKGELEYQVDKHCNYCPNLKECKAAHDYLIEKDLGETPSVKDMVRAIKYFKLLEKKINLYKDDIRTRIEMGENIDNVTLRKGRKIEIVSNADLLLDLAEFHNIDTDLLYDKKLKTPKKLREALKDTNLELDDVLLVTNGNILWLNKGVNGPWFFFHLEVGLTLVDFFYRVPPGEWFLGLKVPLSAYRIRETPFGSL